MAHDFLPNPFRRSCGGSEQTDQGFSELVVADLATRRRARDYGGPAGLQERQGLEVGAPHAFNRVWRQGLFVQRVSSLQSTGVAHPKIPVPTRNAVRLSHHQAVVEVGAKDVGRGPDSDLADTDAQGGLDVGPMQETREAALLVDERRTFRAQTFADPQPATPIGKGDCATLRAKERDVGLVGLAQMLRYLD